MKKVDVPFSSIKLFCKIISIFLKEKDITYLIMSTITTMMRIIRTTTATAIPAMSPISVLLPSDELFSPGFEAPAIVVVGGVGGEVHSVPHNSKF